MPPTLLNKGSAVALDGEDKQEVAEMTGIEYLLKWFTPRISQEEGVPASAEPKSYGDKVLLLESKTGTGKSTVLPPALFDAFYETIGRTIICTQPRVINAIDIPRGIIKFNSFRIEKGKEAFKLGENIGYQTGSFIKKAPKGLLFATIGILRQQLITLTDKQFIDKYSMILIDEVHTRSTDLDITLYLLKQFLKRNWQNTLCPIIVCMSATFEIDKMSAYFETKHKKYIQGQSMPIVENFPKYDVMNIFTAAADQALEIHDKFVNDITENKINRDIIIFISGEAASKKIIKILDMANKTLEYKILNLTINGDTIADADENFKAITAKLNTLRVVVDNVEYTPSRRIFVSSNVAETGVTISSLGYCIDTAYHRSIEYNPVFNVDVNIVKPITQSMARQRRGRVGREAPGSWYPLFTEKTFNNLIKDQYPDIILAECVDVLLGIAATPEISTDNENIETYKPINCMDLGLMDSPPADSIHMALEKLFVLGAIDSRGVITKLGLIMNKFRKISFESVKMILSGYMYNIAITDLIVIAMMIADNRYIADRDVFNDSKLEGKFCDGNYMKFKREVACEFIECLNIWNLFMREITVSKNIHKWCEEHGLSYKILISIGNSITDLTNGMLNINLNPYYGTKFNTVSEKVKLDQVKRIKSCIYEGYRLNLAKYVKVNRNYMTQRSHISFNPGSTLLGPINKKYKFVETYNPKFILSNEYVIQNIPLVKENLFEYTCKFITILDGFVNVDISF